MDVTLESRYEYSERRIIENRRRREKELKRHLLVVVLSVVLFIILVLLFSNTKSVASDGSEEVLYKYYKSVMIESGDSLWKISESYSENGYSNLNDYMDEIVFINNLNKEAPLICGNYLVIPYYDVYNG